MGSWSNELVGRVSRWRAKGSEECFGGSVGDNANASKLEYPIQAYGTNAMIDEIIDMIKGRGAEDDEKGQYTET